MDRRRGGGGKEAKLIGIIMDKACCFEIYIEISIEFVKI